MAAAFFLTMAVLVARKRRFVLFTPIGLFALVLAGYGAWANAAAERHDLVARKMIYQFYNSQGWSEKPPGAPGLDIEMEGYLYATQIYGSIADNNESLATAVARHPTALAHRIAVNAKSLLVSLFAGFYLFSRDLLLLLIALPLACAVSERRHRMLLAFAGMVFSVIGMFLIFHIDPRYVTICVPAAIMLSLLCVHSLNSFTVMRPLGQNTFAALTLGVLFLHLPAHFVDLARSFAPHRLDLSTIRSLVDGFLREVHSTSEQRRHMQVALQLALPRGERAEDFFMFS